MAERIHAGNFDSKVLADGTFALVDFYSDSCVPCKRMSPVLAELEESYAGKLYVGKVNIAYEPELVEKYEVSSAPTLVFFKDGKENTASDRCTEKSRFREIHFRKCLRRI